MNTHHLNRKTMVTGGMFLAPVLVVQFALPLHGVMGKPKSASATPVTTDMPVAVTALPAPTTDQLVAVEHMRALRTDTISLASPFYYPPRSVEPHRADPVVHARTQPQFRITSILEARDGRVLAMINGKMCDVGTSPLEGWTITAIDAEAKTVTLREDERDEELVLQFGSQNAAGPS